MLTEQIAAILGQWMAGSFSIRGVDYSAAKNHTLRWPDDFSEAEQEGFRAVAQEVGHLQGSLDTR